MSAVAPIIEVTARGLFGRRRILLLILLGALPVLIGLLIRITGGHPDADRVLDTLEIRFVLPLVALIVGTTVLGSEIDDGTAVFLLVKPVARWRIVLAKAIVATGLTALLTLPFVIVASVLLRPDDLTTTIVAFTVGCFLGGAAYTIAFLTLSVFTTRAFLIGLAYVLIWEGVLSGLLEGTKFLSIRQATLGLTAALGAQPAGESAPLASNISLVVLLVVIVGGFVLASWRLARFEIRGGD